MRRILARALRQRGVRPRRVGLIAAGLVALLYLVVGGIENRGDACGALLTAALVGLIAALATRRPKPRDPELRSSRI